MFKTGLKKSIAVATLGMFCALSTGLAGTEANVNATVTVQNIALTASDGVVAYGTLGQNSTRSTCTSEGNDLQTITNTGNVNEDFDIKGYDSASWTLAGSAGADAYVHSWKNGTCATFSGGTALTLINAEFATSIAASGTANLNLQINTPNPSSVFTQQNANVTLTASAS